MIQYISFEPNVPPHDYWDHAVIEDLIEGIDLEASDRQIVVIPGQFQGKHIDRINHHINQHPKVLVMITSDEKALFPHEELEHPDMILWVMLPDREKHRDVNRYLINGWSPDTKHMLRNLGPVKKTDRWFFSGQMNHTSREKMVEVIKGSPLLKRKGEEIFVTEGFTKGMGHEEYFERMAKSKVIPCPGGYYTPDSFRLYEALEAGCIPIPYDKKYIHMLLGDTPFPVLDSWDTLPDIIENMADRYPWFNNEVFAWWQMFKRQMKYDLRDDLGLDHGKVTVIIPTSPIPSHPSTEIIERTVKSVREQLPDAEILITIDGVKEKQLDRSEDYQEYVRRLLWKCNHDWTKVYPMLFQEHMHQSGMTRAALDKVRTPYVIYVEHDTPFTGEIDWDGVFNVMDSKIAKTIRFHFEDRIPEVHKNLMLDKPKKIKGVKLMPTAQWSQRPHISDTEFYRQMMRDYFTEESRIMIEDVVYGPIETAFKERGKPGWQDWKIYLYAPDGGYKRSLNLDGRENDSKFEESYIK